LEEMKEKLQNEEREILFLGDILDKKSKEELLFSDKVTLAHQNLNIPKASSIPYLLMDEILSGQAENLHELVPLYMRKSQAENEYEKKKGMLK